MKAGGLLHTGNHVELHEMFAEREMLADPQTADSHYLDLPVAFLSW